jgi:hypothetical protein
MKNQSKQGIGRREFLVVTSTTAIAAMAFGQDLIGVPSLKAASGSNFALGFVDPEAVIDGASSRFVANVGSADRLTQSDGALIRGGARLTIRSSHVSDKSANAPSGMQLIVQYVTSSDGTRRTFPFTAWSYSKTSGTSSPVRFVVPVDQEQTIRLLLATSYDGQASSAVSRRNLLQTASAVESAADPDVINLSLLSGSGGAKLRTGHYIIVPTRNGASAPDWANVSLRNDEGLKLVTNSGFTVAPVDFDYVIVTIDMASDKPTAPVTPKPALDR